MNLDDVKTSCKLWSELSDRAYSPHNIQHDPIQGERYRLRAAALRHILGGSTVDDSISIMRAEWLSFCKEANAKVDAATKLKLGPYSGCSSIHYRHADPGAIDADEINIRITCR